MFSPVHLPQRRISDFEPIIGAEAIQRLRELAASVTNKRVLHLTVAQQFGTRVAETLSAIVPLLIDLGVPSEWQVLRATEDSMRTMNVLYRTLGGDTREWRPDVEMSWLEYLRFNASQLDDQFDVVVAHDPQTAGLAMLAHEVGGPSSDSRWIWHNHIDLSSAPDTVRRLFLRYAAGNSLVLASSLDSLGPAEDQSALSIRLVNQGIDPLNVKNADAGPALTRAVVEAYGLHPEAPLILQAAPPDGWHNSLMLIDAFEQVKKQAPSLQLVLATPTIPLGGLGPPEILDEVMARSSHIRDMRVLSGNEGIGNAEINALQRAAAVVAHLSSRRLFHFGIAEASWKARPVIGAAEGMALPQIVDERCGYTISGLTDLEEHIAALIQSQELRHMMGEGGRELVRSNFLVTNLLEDYLRILNQDGS